VIATPGHTPACVSFLLGDALFTGDALFMEDYGTGRCDFPKGSADELYTSVHDKLYALPDETRVFVGHDYQPDGRALRFETTIGASKTANIQLRAETPREAFVKFRKTRDATLAGPAAAAPERAGERQRGPAAEGPRQRQALPQRADQPNHGRSFVDAATGALGLHVVLVPAADRAAATVGLAAARQLLALAGVATEPTRVVLGHVGATAHDLEDLGVEVMNVPGDVVDGVVALATMIDADLVVMPTHGHDAVLDAVRGSTTERVTRRLGRPLLSVPLPT
jgi:nucleotide-binding universal stress UspA family protein